MAGLDEGRRGPHSARGPLTKDFLKLCPRSPITQARAAWLMLGGWGPCGHPLSALCSSPAPKSCSTRRICRLSGSSLTWTLGPRTARHKHCSVPAPDADLGSRRHSRKGECTENCGKGHAVLKQVSARFCSQGRTDSTKV